MTEATQKMKELLLKRTIKVDLLLCAFDMDTLKAIKGDCIGLLVKLCGERLIVETVLMKAHILDDIRNVEENLRVINSAIKLRENRFGTFCFN